MNKPRLLCVGSLFLGISFVANATPIEITQIFHDTNLIVLV